MSEPLLSCSLGPEDFGGLVAALEQALIALGIEDRNDPMTELVAKKVFEIRLSATAMSMSLTGARFSSESAPRPFHDGVRGEVEQSLGRRCR